MKLVENGVAWNAIPVSRPAGVTVHHLAHATLQRRSAQLQAWARPPVIRPRAPPLWLIKSGLVAVVRAPIRVHTAKNVLQGTATFEMLLPLHRLHHL